MKRTTIRIIISVATILLVGLVVTQIFWVRNAYQIQERQFNYDVTNSLIGVAKEIRQQQSDSTPVIDPVLNHSINLYLVTLNDTVDAAYLEALLSNAFKGKEINLEFEYAIHDCFRETTICRRKEENPESQGVIVASTAPEVEWGVDGHYFTVYFPSISGQLFSQLDFWIYSSLLLLVVIVFFAYTISIILRQKRLSEIKTDFINNMTHELKTPISTISLSSERLLKPDILDNPDRLFNYAGIIRNENQRLQNQVERVLQMATLDSEKIKLKKKAIDINEIVQKVVSTIELKVKERDGHINLQLNADPSIVQADEIHLTNMIYNLLDNANKYSQDKPIINVRTDSRPKGVRITVQDQGLGIEKEHQRYIFDRFYRVPKGNVHDVKGFGLGLYYVRTMAQAHHGSVSFTSEFGQGSTFELYLPFS